VRETAATRAAVSPGACDLPAGQLYVQVGAYAQSSSAGAVAAQMVSIGRVRLEPAFVNGVAVAKVRLGPVLANDARSLLGRVQQLGYDGAFIAPANGGPAIHCL
jgi:hypothetical protein